MKTFLKRPALAAALLTGLILTPTAFASEPKCTEAKDLVELFDKMSSFTADQTDTLSLQMDLIALKEDGSVMTERMFYRAPDGVETDLTIEADGEVSNLPILAGKSEEGEMCRAGRNGETPEQKSSMSMNIGFNFHNKSGSHSFDEIKDGLTDGTAQMKSLAPAAVRMLVPKLKYIVATPDNPDTQTVVLTAQKDGQPVVLDVKYYAGMQAISLADLKKARADSVLVTGGPYVLQAMPKPGKDELSDTPQSPDEIDAAADSAP